MALGDRRREKGPAVQLRLQITSMMDMFTIILIFLLFSFSTEPEIPRLDTSLRLPESSSAAKYKEGLKLVLTESRLKLGDVTLALVKDGSIEGIDTVNPEESRTYGRIRYYLKQAAEKMKESDRSAHILFLCDKRLPFKTINHVVKAAAGAGYPNFKFTVLQKT